MENLSNPTAENLEILSRKDLQSIAKQYGVKANLKSSEIIEQILGLAQ
jgi:hypothetical protein